MLHCLCVYKDLVLELFQEFLRKLMPLLWEDLLCTEAKFPLLSGSKLAQSLVLVKGRGGVVVLEKQGLTFTLPVSNLSFSL